MSDSLQPRGQVPLPSTVSQSLLRFMSTESVMLSNHLILCCPLSSSPQSFPASGSFPVSWLFTSGGQIIGASASATVLPMNIQGGFPLGLIGLIFLLSKGLSKECSPAPPFESITSWYSAFFMIQLSHPCITTGKNNSFDYINLCWQSLCFLIYIV